MVCTHMCAVQPVSHLSLPFLLPLTPLYFFLHKCSYDCI